MALMNGGTFLIDSPRPYSAVADGVLKAIGIDAAALAPVIQKQDPDFYEFHESTGMGLFFDRETFGADHLAVGFRHRPWREFLAATPLSPAARRDVERIESGKQDYMPGLTSTQKKQRLMKISYRDYLRDIVRVDPQVLALYQAQTQGLWGVGIDAVSALDCWGVGQSGFDGLKLEPGSIPGMGFTPAGYADTGGSLRLHFPDGNATIARGLVRRLIPAAVPGTTVEDLITARVDYARLDRPGEPVRLRLSSTAVRVRNDAAPAAARSTSVTYMRDGRAFTVRGRDCVLAGYNMMIPYLVPELPETQRRALHELVKTPLVYTSVAIRNARAFEKLGIRRVYAPAGYHTTFTLNATVDIGSYRSPRSPDEPTLIWMQKTPCKPGLPEHEQNRIGRAELLATTFEDFERNIRDQLNRILGPGGFDAANDITAITVNRWPHGYAPEHNSLWEPELPEDQTPQVLGRARFGRIAIANSDSGGGAYTDVAIEQAHRAVGELLGSQPRRDMARGTPYCSDAERCARALVLCGHRARAGGDRAVHRPGARRRLRHRRRLRRPVDRAAPGAARSRRRAAGAVAPRLGRIRAQRRPGARRHAARPALARGARRARRRAPPVGFRARRARASRLADRDLWHRLRAAPRPPAR